MALWTSAILGAVTLLLYLFVFDMWVVPPDEPMFVASLEPTLQPFDRILTRRGSTPVTGELAKCTVSDGSGKVVVGRVFGSRGETVEINNERVTINGKAPKVRFGCGSVNVVNPVSGEATPLSCSTEDNGNFTYNVLVSPELREGQTLAKVEPDKFFLVSDNRHLHMDSRDYGQVDVATCEHVVYRLWGQSFGDASRRFTILW